MNKTTHEITSEKEILKYLLDSFVTNDENMLSGDVISLKYLTNKFSTDLVDAEITKAVTKLLSPYFNSIKIEITNVGEFNIVKKLKVIVVVKSIELTYDNEINIDEINKYT